MMNQSKQFKFAALAGALLAMMMMCAPASAVRLVAPQVSGTVTAISGTVAVTVDGKQYMIGAGTVAAQQIVNVHVGDQIGLVFDGPVSRSGTHVVGITLAPAP
jgi:hypothetical protein